jgi:hypothetical protein
MWPSAIIVRGERKEAEGESKFDRPVLIRRERALLSGAVAGLILKSLQW